MKGREANANLDKNNLPAKIQLKHEQRIFPSSMANSAQSHCRTFEQHFSFLCYNALVELMIIFVLQLFEEVRKKSYETEEVEEF